MKKEAVFFVLLALIFILPFASSLNETIENKAYKCIEDQVKTKTCSAFGPEDKIFALLSVKKCQQELLSSAINKQCWGASNTCSIKLTSQAILALSESGADIKNYTAWILSKNISSPELDWLIQIESAEATICDIEDSNSNNYQVSIEQDKKILGISNSQCLEIDETGYWIKIKPNCYNQEFDITCDKDFLTSLLFKKKTSSTIHIFKKVQTSSGGGTNVEKMSSLCFKEGSSCSYEGTLWASLILKKLKYDISSYLPYLIAFEEDNDKFLPESFLYYLTGQEDFKSDLIFKQKKEKYWEESGDKFYDTAVALLSLSSDEVEAKQNTINWLSDPAVQGSDGCWNSGSVKHTGFLLYSLWPKAVPGGDGEVSDDCEDAGFFCLSSDTQCSDAGGKELSSYSCYGFFDVCCDKDKLSDTCESLDGIVCKSGEDCDGTEEYGIEGLIPGETCCVGDCKKSEPPLDDTCTPAGGACRETCETNEKEDFNFDCLDILESCCMKKTQGTAWWIWLLIILIILIVIAIILRDKLKNFFYKMKYGGKSSKEIPRAGAPPSESFRRPVAPPRRILPSQQPIRRPLPQTRGKTGELDDVLKKLKEMGK